VAQVRAACASGTLRAGDRLPSVRELARELAVNQNTILRVYERLTAEGLLDRRHGDGTYVADRLPGDPGSRLRVERQALADELARVARQAGALGVGADELHDLLDAAISEAGGAVADGAAANAGRRRLVPSPRMRGEG
ncbi:MAG TPA: GntR family transcriptional regulator, partial [Tepidisphaeraceae bacterium]|nr:GntR family transcriptional regulator [Tepidisphaeraceae bacterium]